MNALYYEELRDFCNSIRLDEFKNKSILITGASGLIGSYLVDLLMQNNIDNNYNTKIYGIVRDYNKAGTRFERYKKNNLFRIIQQDISVSCDFKFSVNYIIHAASNATPKSFDKDPIGTIRANVYGLMNVLAFSKTCNVSRVLFISSSEIYGEVTDKYISLTEDSLGIVDQLKPRSCYTESKRMAENICVNYSKQYGANCVIARVCFAYGATFSKNDNRVIPQFLSKALNHESIIMKSTGELLRSYAYLYDVASGLFTIMCEGKTGEAYNIANSKSNVTIKEIAEIIARNTDTKIIYDLPKENSASGYSPFTRALLDASKLLALGWVPLFDMEKGLKRTIEILKVED